MPIQPGSRLGTYVITRSLGGGGMGEVFEARDTRLDRRVAIKTLRPELLSDERARRRFEREAKALSGINHPNVCTVFDIGHHEGTDFIVMEYVDGETLAVILDRGTLAAPQVIRYAAQIADGLAEAHDHGILHRDIKPHNVMVSARGQIKVLDFGLAKTLQPDAADAVTVSDISVADALVGTAPYMSPEQVRGDAVDGRSDVFSFGSLMYECLAGCSPFREATTAETLSAILTREPAPLSRLAPSTTPELQRIVRKCLEKDRTRRYQTARDIATDLENLSRDSVSVPRIDSPSRQHRTASVRPKAMVGAAAAVLAVILATAALLFWRTAGPAEAPAIRSIAILPLKPLGNAVGENYLGVGITDGVVTRLSRSRGLIVRPTSAVRRYADGDADAFEAAAALQVDAILEGTWQRDGDTIRVSANLLRRADGSSIWADQFDFPSSEVFLIQGRVADALASRLRLELDSGNRATIQDGRPATRNVEAYDAYLRGQFHLSERSYSPTERQGTDQAIGLLERAVTLDPSYAEAHAKLGFAYAHVAIFFEDNPSLIERSKRATDAAERLRPDLGQVQLNRALIGWSWYEGWRIVDAIRAYHRAAELDPSLSDIELSAGYAHLGVFNEWRRAGEGVIARDPTNRNARATFVNEHFLLNLPEEGVAAQKRLLDESPDERYFLLTGRVADARPIVEGNAARLPGNQWALIDLALLRALEGRHREAATHGAQAIRAAVRNRSYHHMTYTLARVHGLAGNGDEAARWLEETIAWGFPCYPVFATDAALDPVRQHPRVAWVLSEVKAVWEGYRDAVR